jgi:hypothetical protein
VHFGQQPPHVIRVSLEQGRDFLHAFSPFGTHSFHNPQLGHRTCRWVRAMSFAHVVHA